MLTPDEIKVAPANGKPTRLVMCDHNGGSYRDKCDCDSEASRARFIGKVGKRFGYDPSDLKWLHSSLPQLADDADDAVELEVGEAGNAQNTSQATKLVALGDEAELFHNGDGSTFATIPIGDHREVWPLRSKGFKRWLCRQFFEKYATAPGSQAVADAMTVLDGSATFSGPETETAVRLAGTSEAVYLDLANSKWQAVEIDADGWRILDDPPVKFRRPRVVMPLPTP